MGERHAPITTLEEYDALDRAECEAGYMEYRTGDPEPGMNRSRSYHHGWRCARFDKENGKVDGYDEHLRLVRAIMARLRAGGANA